MFEPEHNTSEAMSQGFLNPAVCAGHETTYKGRADAGGPGLLSCANDS